MLVIENQEYFNSVKEFAARIGKLDDLNEKLSQLENWGTNTRCNLYRDIAPYSFYFVIEVLKENEWKRYFNGGLIFHGPHDGGGDGGAPTFSVSLTPVHGWSIHT